MSSSPIVAAFVAVLVAVSGFSALSLSAPVGYPEGAALGEGLIRAIVFDEGEYRSPCYVGGRLVIVNPTDGDVIYELEYPIEYSVSDGWGYSLGRRGEGLAERATVPAHGEYTVTRFSIDAGAPGFYGVEWEGLWEGVYVERGELVPRLVTDKLVYDQYENIYLSFEYYNPKPYSVTFQPPSRVMFWMSLDGGEAEPGPGSFISWVGPVTVPPGGTLHLPRYYVATPSAGILTFYGMGTSRTIHVLPVER